MIHPHRWPYVAGHENEFYTNWQFYTIDNSWTLKFDNFSHFQNVISNNSVNTVNTKGPKQSFYFLNFLSKFYLLIAFFYTFILWMFHIFLCK